MNNQIKEDMKSILDNRPELVKEVNKVAEVAGYLWQKELENLTIMSAS